MNNRELYQWYSESGLSETEFWRVHQTKLRALGVHSYDSLHGRLWRAQQTDAVDDRIFNVSLPPLLILPEGRYGVFGDVHVSSADYGWLNLLLAMTEKYLERPRAAILAGDLYNNDAASPHQSEIQPTPFYRELQAARIVVEELLKVYDAVYFLLGNHDRWITNKTQGVVSPEVLKEVFHSCGSRFYLSYREYCRIKNNKGNGHDWVALHGSGSYSAIPTNNARKYALIHHVNVIAHHEHHFGATFDESGRYMVISNGGLFNPERIWYYQQRLPKRAMVQGFTLLREGYPLMFGPEPWTNWSLELPINNKSA